jgi:hypothetical protein
VDIPAAIGPLGEAIFLRAREDADAGLRHGDPSSALRIGGRFRGGRASEGADNSIVLSSRGDEGKLAWTTHVTNLWPVFKLGDADTTSRVLVEHLICACTGLPRQDYEWLFQYRGVTPDGELATLATVQPTSKRPADHGHQQGEVVRPQ